MKTMMKYFLVAIMLVGCFVSCEQKAKTTSVSTSGIGKTVEKNTNKQKLIDALNEAEIAYRNAKSRDELNAAEIILKQKAAEVQGQCTINELKEIEKDKLYIDAWNKCMKAYSGTYDKLYGDEDEDVSRIPTPNRHDLLVENAYIYANHLVKAIQNYDLPAYQAWDEKLDEYMKGINASSEEYNEVSEILWDIFGQYGITEDDINAMELNLEGD